jgi:hypothetical protein
MKVDAAPPRKIGNRYLTSSAAAKYLRGTS